MDNLRIKLGFVTLIALQVTNAVMVKEAGPSPYASDGENYFCARPFSTSYPLPCRAPRDDYKFSMKDDFVITAWWPPIYDQLKLYADANFNLLLAGNLVASACQTGRPYSPPPEKAKIPTPATMTEAFDCQMSVLGRLRELGLKMTWTYGKLMNQSVSSIAVGESASYGGVIQNNLNNHYLSDREAQYVVKEFDKRNLSDVISMIFLHDDDPAVEGNTARITEWLRLHANTYPPQVNTFPDSGAETLYHSRQFVYAPEEYPIHGVEGDSNAMTAAQLINFVNDQYIAERYRLDLWPLFATGDGGAVPAVRSESLVQVQIYSALAYGARGLYYYCWGHGIIEWPSMEVSTIYETVKTINGDALVWGKMLIKQRHVGAITTGVCNSPPMTGDGGNEGGQCVRPQKNLVVTDVSSQMLVGVFSATASGDDGLLMIVDTRTFMNPADTPPDPARTVNLALNEHCMGEVMAPGKERYIEDFDVKWTANNRNLSVTLDPGQGVLVKVSGAGCGASMRSIRRWWFNPRVMNLRRSENTEESVKPATFGMYNSQARSFQPQMAGSPSGFIVGASYWEAGGFDSDEEARLFAMGGFSMVSLPIADQAKVIESLEWSALHGFFFMGTTQPAPLDASTVLALSENYSCHTNFAGLIVQDQSHGAPLKHDVLSAMKSVAYWQIPLIVNANSTETAIIAARSGAPLAAVVVPLYATNPQKIIEVLTSIRTAAEDEVNEMTASITLSACETESDSIMRFAAYMALPMRIQAIWWEGLGKCAKVASHKFDLISSINTRSAQWTDALFLKLQNGSYPYEINQVFSTATTVNIENATKPGTSKDDIVKSMTAELVAFVLSTADGLASYLYIVSTELSADAGGARGRPVEIILRDDVNTTRPVEGGMAEPNCYMHFLGNVAPMVLPGGSAQLLSLSINVTSM